MKFQSTINKAWFLGFAFCMVGIGVKAQNLIPNPSFELVEKCPESNMAGLPSMRKKITTSWISPNQGSVDYYTNCNPLAPNVPMNYAGTAMPYEGQNYLGLVARKYFRDRKTRNYYHRTNYREYIQSELKETLVAGSVYIFSIHVRQAVISNLSLDTLGVHFGNKRIKGRDGLLLRPRALLNFPIIDTVFNNIGWLTLCDTFRATGNEQFITIGNFTAHKGAVEIQKFRNDDFKEDGPGIYILVDQVELYEYDKSMDFPLSQLEQYRRYFYRPNLEVTSGFSSLPSNQLFVMDSVFFETNSSKLDSASLVYLAAIAERFVEIEDKQIEIHGHTDSKGKAEKNQLLSEKRAHAVVDCLTENGVNADRLTAIGFGSSEPLKSNETEEGRAKNRRVEMIILR
ncbi:OmpA family protein [Salibacteraceae bacterium]|nr:OmpA family protein [Salibacteraceae bacterium]